jgi:hypothetical protein
MPEPLRIDPARLRAVVLEAIAGQPDPTVAADLHRRTTWRGVEVGPIRDHPDRFVISTDGIPLAIVCRDTIEDTTNGVTGGLSTPEGYRK